MKKVFSAVSVLAPWRSELVTHSFLSHEQNRCVTSSERLRIIGYRFWGGHISWFTGNGRSMDIVCTAAPHNTQGLGSRKIEVSGRFWIFEVLWHLLPIFLPPTPPFVGIYALPFQGGKRLIHGQAFYQITNPWLQKRAKFSPKNTVIWQWRAVSVIAARLCMAGTRAEVRMRAARLFRQLSADEPFHCQVQKNTFSKPFKEKCISEVSRIDWV